MGKTVTTDTSVDTISGELGISRNTARVLISTYAESTGLNPSCSALVNMILTDGYVICNPKGAD